MYGYLWYNTAFSGVWRAIGSLDFLVHHAVALACCAFGLYCKRLALFGMAIQELIVPILHIALLGINHMECNITE